MGECVHTASSREQAGRVLEMEKGRFVPLEVLASALRGVQLFSPLVPENGSVRACALEHGGWDYHEVIAAGGDGASEPDHGLACAKKALRSFWGCPGRREGASAVESLATTLSACGAPC